MDTVAPDRDLIHQAPKVVLHDHLDGGLRPTTVVELADLTRYRDLPTTEPAELANVIAFVASDEASRMHGAIVSVDGGLTAG